MQRLQELEEALAAANIRISTLDDHAKQVDHPLAGLKVRESPSVRRYQG